jgi:hypothetical protein
MPRPIRFVAAWFAGLLLVALLLPTTASLERGGRPVWTALFNWIGSPAFWSVVWLLSGLVGGTLLLTRLAVRAGLPGLLSGLIGGGLSGLCYLVFYVSGSELARAQVLPHLGAGALLFVGALGLAGAVMAWFWQRAA